MFTVVVVMEPEVVFNQVHNQRESKTIQWRFTFYGLLIGNTTAKENKSCEEGNTAKIFIMFFGEHPSLGGH